MVKGIIFDVDGTTLSTLEDIQNSLNIVLGEYGYGSQDLESVRLYIGRGSRNLIKDSLPVNTNEDVIDEITSRYIDIYSQNYNIKTHPYDGIKELLDKIEDMGIILAINSNKPDKITKNLISHHFPGNNYISIIGSREGIPNKPDPYSANEIVKLMGLNKDEVLYVGDSESDIKTAKNAGLKSVGCLWGFRDIEVLTKAQTDIIIKEPKELLNYLK